MPELRLHCIRRYIISVSGYRLDRDWLPQERQWIQTFQRRHKTGQEALCTHDRPFRIAAGHINNVLRVIAIGRHEAEVSGA